VLQRRQALFVDGDFIFSVNQIGTPHRMRYHPDRGLFGWPPPVGGALRVLNLPERRRLFRRQDRWRRRPDAGARQAFFRF